MSNYVPNTFQTPNVIIDKLMPLLTNSEFRVLMFITREILGWRGNLQNKRAHISQSRIANGYTYTNAQGEKVSVMGCGVKISTVKNALKSLSELRIVKKIGTPTQKGQMWELSLLTEGNIDFTTLNERNKSKEKDHKEQTEKARSVNPKNLGGTVQQIDSKGDCSTDTRGDCSTDYNETQETQETHNIAPDGAVVSDEVIESDVPEALSVMDKPKVNLWQEVMRRALGTPQNPKQAGGYVGRYIKFVKGEYETGKKSQSSQHQLSDEPMTEQELVAFTLWYRNTYDRDSIPTTYETLRNRIDEYRSTSGTYQYEKQAQAIVQRLVAGEDQKLTRTVQPHFTVDLTDFRPPMVDDDMVVYEKKELPNAS